MKILIFFCSFLLCGSLIGKAPQAPSRLLVIPESNDEDGFRIERRENEKWHVVGELPADTTTFTSTGCKPFTPYKHRVVAFNESGESPSPVVTGKTFNLLSHRRAEIIETGSSRQGEGSFLLLENGDLELYYSDMVTVSDLAESQISKKVSRDNGKTWSERVVVASEPGMALFLPGTLRLENGNLLLSYARRVPGEWHSKRVVRISTDGAKTWSEEYGITDNSFDYSTGSHDRIYQLSNGDVIILVHSVSGNGEIRPRHLVTDVYGSSDNGRTWQKRTEEPLDLRLNPFESSGEYGFWECTLAELENGELLMLGRNASGWLYGTRSHDYGHTWGKPYNLGVQNPLAPPYLKKIAGTNTLILLNSPILPAPDRLFGQRYVLGSRISTDGGRTWSNFKEIENHTHNWWYDYPHMIQEGDTMHLSYRAIEMTPDNQWGRVNMAYLKLPVSWFLE